MSKPTAQSFEPPTYTTPWTLGDLLRSCLYVVFLTLTMVPWAVATLFVSIFVRGARLYHFTITWLHIAMWGARVICGVSVRVHGREHLEAAQKLPGVIVLSKHQSTWETFAFPCLMPRPLCFVFKRELLFIPFFGWAMGRLDMVHIDRRKRTEAWALVAKQGQAFMRQGHWVIMFPEGTRIPRGQSGAFKTGGTRLAVATGAAVLPVAVNSARQWPRKSALLRPGVVEVSIGAPIASEGREPDELMRQVQAWIDAETARLDPEAHPSGQPLRLPTDAPRASSASAPAPAPALAHPPGG